MDRRGVVHLGHGDAGADPQERGARDGRVMCAGGRLMRAPAPEDQEGGASRGTVGGGVHQGRGQLHRGGRTGEAPWPNRPPALPRGGGQASITTVLASLSCQPWRRLSKRIQMKPR